MRSQLGGDRDLRGVGSGNNGGEYDPVQMVKKAMAMKATGAAGTKKQSSGSAGQSLRELEREQRKRKEEFDEIHRKRQELSRALKAGKLSRDGGFLQLCGLVVCLIWPRKDKRHCLSHCRVDS